jgi:glycyl-tRNA synthetase beta chain
MIDSEVVDAEIFGLRSANRTFGHRFHAPGALEIPVAADYESLLLSQGLVMASFEKRRDAIRHMVEQEAARLGGMAHIEDALLDEVTALVEYPVAVCGQFDIEFLQLPAEVLVTTMQENQKYFALFDSDGALLPHFIAICDPAQVCRRRVLLYPGPEAGPRRDAFSPRFGRVPGKARQPWR